MVEIDKLNGLHFDILKEIGNIGASHAVTSLSQMLNTKVGMNVPRTLMLSFNEVANAINGAENLVAGILIGLTGEVTGLMMFLVEANSAVQLLNGIMGTNLKGVEEFGEMEQSAIMEIGNIMSGSYLAALSSLTQLKITPSIPYFTLDMAGAILSVPAIEFGKVADTILFIESTFIGAGEEDISGYFLLVPDLQSFNTILQSLGVM